MGAEEAQIVGLVFLGIAAVLYMITFIVRAMETGDAERVKEAKVIDDDKGVNIKAIDSAAMFCFVLGIMTTFASALLNK